MPPIEQLIATARCAGEAILAVRNSGAFATRAKDDSSPLTAADLEADRIIAEALSRLDPDTPRLSEEGPRPSADSDWKRFWCIDPLDGTKEFLSGSPEFTVNIALVEAGKPILGVVHAPAIDGSPVWWGGSSAHGAWVQRNGIASRIVCRAAPAPPTPLRIVASKSHRDAATDAWIAGLGRPVDVVAAGSSLKFCLVAEGLADFYPRFGTTCAWDTAAAHAVVLGAGGRVLRAAGGGWRYMAHYPLNAAFIVSGIAD